MMALRIETLDGCDYSSAELGIPFDERSIHLEEADLPLANLIRLRRIGIVLADLPLANLIAYMITGGLCF
jgi:hypothetical protein